MVKTGGAIEDFIEKLSAAARPAGDRDRDLLLDRLRTDRPQANEIDAADASYYTELVRRESFNVDSQEARPYFDSTKVQQGLLDVTGRLLGLEYRRLPGAATWHGDVDVYDVLVDGELIGRIHLDLHPRDGKFKHAAMFEMSVGIEGAQVAEGALACNLPTGLMEHSDVVTLFHEFGHLVHHILANGQRFAALAGIATEWDFVEAPSQMLEEWAWDAGVLRTFATNAAGEPIPEELVNRMRAADEFGNGIQVCTQTFYSAVSYRLHRDLPADRTKEIEQLQDRYSVFAYLPDTHFQATSVTSPGTRRPITRTCGAWSSPRIFSRRSIRPTCLRPRSRADTETWCSLRVGRRMRRTSSATSWVATIRSTRSPRG